VARKYRCICKLWILSEGPPLRDKLPYIDTNFMQPYIGPPVVVSQITYAVTNALQSHVTSVFIQLGAVVGLCIWTIMECQ